MILPTASISSLLPPPPLLACHSCFQGSHDCETIKEKAEALKKLVCVIGTVWLCHDCLSCNDAAKTFCLKVKAKGSKTKRKLSRLRKRRMLIRLKILLPVFSLIKWPMSVRSTGRGTVPTAGLDTEWLTVLFVSNPTPAHASNTWSMVLTSREAAHRGWSVTGSTLWYVKPHCRS